MVTSEPAETWSETGPRREEWGLEIWPMRSELLAGGRSFWVIVGCWLGMLVGCGQDEFGMQVEIPDQDRMAVTHPVREGLTIRLPDAPFNVHSRQSAQTPGATGRARGDSDAGADGKAACQAQANEGGSAWGEFQLGHALRNAGATALRVTVTLDLDYSLGASTEPADAKDTLAGLTLKVFLKDTQGRVLHHEVLDSLSSDEATGEQSGRQQVAFEAVLLPEAAYDLVLAGRVSTTSEPGSKAAASIEVRQLRAELRFAPATEKSTAEGKGT